MPNTSYKSQHISRWLVTVVILIALCSSSPLSAQTASPTRLTLPAPSAKDTCPVCGMFVSLYPEWVATVLYKDGHAHHFDGAKDLFKYLLNLPKYAPNHDAKNITAIGVTEYYSLTRINARSAWYVIGSDVLGPMGHELLPLATEAEARDFLHDHKGKRIIHFNDINQTLLEQLDKGHF